MITLATLPQATEQEVFDQVARHLLTQNERATDDGCAYRVERLCGVPLMCAAGCLISDKEYRHTMEGVDWSLLVQYGDVPAAHAEFIGVLQRLHDMESVAVWPERLIELAAAHELNAQVVQEVLAARAALP